MSSLINKVFENEFVTALDKPSGVLSVPSRMGANETRPVLGLELQKSEGRPIFPVHRLDEETSGLLLFAKTPHAQKLLSRSFEIHSVQKTYHSLTSFSEEAKALIDQVLVNKLFRGKKRSFEAPHGKVAETLIVSIQDWSPSSPLSKFNPINPINHPNQANQGLLWTLAPKTGRSHQLRVQLALRGFPLWGDKLYGSTLNLPPDVFLPQGSLKERAIGLRAVSLKFSDPLLKSELKMPLELQVQGWD